VQSYESGDLLDSSILVAPLVFFISPNDPRFLRTMDRILMSPEKGGLTSTGLVYRYNTEQSEDGMFSIMRLRLQSLTLLSRCWWP
jgi:GH15 family glucan-1,4-alpha-glucosidase